ncbi:MAG: hypothetical protein AAFX50_16350, partial [Acidobacteriota bacterium]
DPESNALYGNGPLAPGETVIVTLEALVSAEAGAEISNQALVRFDADQDGVNESTASSDDPATQSASDATVLVVMSLAEIPTLDRVGLAAMTLLLILFGLRSARLRRGF